MILRPTYTLHRQQWVGRPLDETFSFFASPQNLPRITPPWLGFRILTPGPLSMASGLVIDYRVCVLGIPIRWRSLITEYDPPHAFRDVQALGPYRQWDHAHRFRARDGGTVIEDRVTYAPPLGPLGVVLNTLVVRRQLTAIFDYRRERIETLLGAATRGSGA